MSVTSLGNCRNPDGSWSGAKTVAKLIGSTEAEVYEMWGRIAFLHTQGQMALREAAQIVTEQRRQKQDGSNH